MIDSNPAKQGVDNRRRRRTEKRPFESWAQLDELAARLGPRYGPPVMFAAATGLRPGEWMALEQRDIDRQARVVYVRRALRNRNGPAWLHNLAQDVCCPSAAGSTMTKSECAIGKLVGS
jgi:integrase